jgi:hypothetical protein
MIVNPIVAAVTARMGLAFTESMNPKDNLVVVTIRQPKIAMLTGNIGYSRSAAIISPWATAKILGVRPLRGHSNVVIRRIREMSGIQPGCHVAASTN